jgi:hypothetical protein
MKIYQAVQKLLVGDTQTDWLTGDFISVLPFLECRLKKLSSYIIQVPRGEEVYSSYPFLTLALDKDEWPASHPGCTSQPPLSSLCIPKKPLLTRG